MTNGWVIIVFENEFKKQFAGEAAYVKGIFGTYEEAIDWAESAEDCSDGEWQITFIE